MRGLDKLHPAVRAKAEELQALCRENGLPLLITETWRSKEEQNALYAKGRTALGKVVTNCKYPHSTHCWGVAFDFCRNVRGKEYDTADGFFQKVGQLGKSAGLFWGGDFKNFKDMPHFEHPEYAVNNSVKTLVEKWGTPEEFKKNWVEKSSPETESIASPSVLADESEQDGGKWFIPEVLKKVLPPNQAQDAVTAETPISSLADEAWEWASQRGFIGKIERHGFITGEMLINLLYRYYDVR